MLPDVYAPDTGLGGITGEVSTTGSTSIDAPEITTPATVALEVGSTAVRRSVYPAARVMPGGRGTICGAGIGQRILNAWGVIVYANAAA